MERSEQNDKQPVTTGELKTIMKSAGVVALDNHDLMIVYPRISDREKKVEAASAGLEKQLKKAINEGKLATVEIPYVMSEEEGALIKVLLDTTSRFVPRSQPTGFVENAVIHDFTALHIRGLYLRRSQTFEDGFPSLVGYAIIGEDLLLDDLIPDPEA